MGSSVAKSQSDVAPDPSALHAGSTPPFVAEVVDVPDGSPSTTAMLDGTTLSTCSRLPPKQPASNSRANPRRLIHRVPDRSDGGSLSRRALGTRRGPEDSSLRMTPGSSPKDGASSFESSLREGHSSHLHHLSGGVGSLTAYDLCSAAGASSAGAGDFTPPHEVDAASFSLRSSSPLGVLARAVESLSSHHASFNSPREPGDGVSGVSGLQGGEEECPLPQPSRAAASSADVTPPHLCGVEIDDCGGTVRETYVLRPAIATGGSLAQVNSPAVAQERRMGPLPTAPKEQAGGSSTPRRNQVRSSGALTGSPASVAAMGRSGLFARGHSSAAPVDRHPLAPIGGSMSMTSGLDGAGYVPTQSMISFLQQRARRQVNRNLLPAQQKPQVPMPLRTRPLKGEKVRPSALARHSAPNVVERSEHGEGHVVRSFSTPDDLPKAPRVAATRRGVLHRVSVPEPGWHGFHHNQSIVCEGDDECPSTCIDQAPLGTAAGSTCHAPRELGSSIGGEKDLVASRDPSPQESNLPRSAPLAMDHIIVQSGNSSKGVSLERLAKSSLTPSSFATADSSTCVLRALSMDSEQPLPSISRAENRGRIPSVDNRASILHSIRSFGSPVAVDGQGDANVGQTHYLVNAPNGARQNGASAEGGTSVSIVGCAGDRSTTGPWCAFPLLSPEGKDSDAPKALPTKVSDGQAAHSIVPAPSSVSEMRESPWPALEHPSSLAVDGSACVTNNALLHQSALVARRSSSGGARGVSGDVKCAPSSDSSFSYGSLQRSHQHDHCPATHAERRKTSPSGRTHSARNSLTTSPAARSVVLSATSSSRTTIIPMNSLKERARGVASKKFPRGKLQHMPPLISQLNQQPKRSLSSPPMQLEVCPLPGSQRRPGSSFSAPRAPNGSVVGEFSSTTGVEAHSDSRRGETKRVEPHCSEPSARYLDVVTPGEQQGKVASLPSSMEAERLHTAAVGSGFSTARSGSGAASRSETPHLGDSGIGCSPLADPPDIPMVSWEAAVPVGGGRGEALNCLVSPPRRASVEGTFCGERAGAEESEIGRLATEADAAAPHLLSKGDEAVMWRRFSGPEGSFSVPRAFTPQQFPSPFHAGTVALPLPPNWDCEGSGRSECRSPQRSHRSGSRSGLALRASSDELFMTPAASQPSTPSALAVCVRFSPTLSGPGMGRAPLGSSCAGSLQGPRAVSLGMRRRIVSFDRNAYVQVENAQPGSPVGGATGPNSPSHAASFPGSTMAPAGAVHGSDNTGFTIVSAMATGSTPQGGDERGGSAKGRGILDATTAVSSSGSADIAEGSYRLSPSTLAVALVPPGGASHVLEGGEMKTSATGATNEALHGSPLPLNDGADTSARGRREERRVLRGPPGPGNAQADGSVRGKSLDDGAGRDVVGAERVGRLCPSTDVSGGAPGHSPRQSIALPTTGPTMRAARVSRCSSNGTAVIDLSPSLSHREGGGCPAGGDSGRSSPAALGPCDTSVIAGLLPQSNGVVGATMHPLCATGLADGQRPRGESGRLPDIGSATNASLHSFRPLPSVTGAVAGQPTAIPVIEGPQRANVAQPRPDKLQLPPTFEFLEYAETLRAQQR